MIDIHTHVLPGIDDGAGSLEEAVSMCRAAAADGCTAVVATPHQRHETWWNSDLARLERLRRKVQAEVGTEIRVLSGAEIRVDQGLLAALDRWPGAEVSSLAGSRYLLIEFSRQLADPDPAGLVHELVVAGWRPVLAHPEEIRWLADDVATLARLVGLGAALQVTAASLTGGYGHKTQDRARRLLDEGLVHFVASDTHDTSMRPPGLSAAAAEITRRWGPAAARLLTVTNPRAVLQNQPLPAPDEALSSAHE